MELAQRDSQGFTNTFRSKGLLPEMEHLSARVKSLVQDASGVSTAESPVGANGRCDASSVAGDARGGEGREMPANTRAYSIAPRP